MKVEGLTFPEAARRLADRAGIEIEETATDAERREADAARRAIDDLYGVNQLARTGSKHSFESTRWPESHGTSCGGVASPPLRRSRGASGA